MDLPQFPRQQAHWHMPGPGIIPRRALEWHLAGCSLLIGGYDTLLAMSGYEPPSLLTLPELRWPALLCLCGLAQLIAVAADLGGFRRWAACAATLCWIYVALALYQHQFYVFSLPASILFAIAEFYVFAILRGAKLWKR